MLPFPEGHNIYEGTMTVLAVGLGRGTAAKVGPYQI